MVKVFASNIQRIKTGFLGDADSFTIVAGNLSPARVLESVKLSVLLYDYTILAAAYFWQSSSMQIITDEVWPFIETGLLLPSIRDPEQTRDVLEYAERRIVDTFSLSDKFIRSFPALASEIATPECLEVAKQLDSKSSVLYRDTGSVEATYKSLWQEDLTNEADPRSIHNIIVHLVPENHTSDVTRVLLSVLNLPFFSRSEIARVIFSFPWKRSLQSSLVHRASFLYLQSNALVTNSDLVTSGSYDSFSSWRSFGPLDYSNLKVFGNALRVLGISSREIANLPAEDILILKGTPEFRAFREIYYRLTLKASGDVRAMQKQMTRTRSMERFRAKAVVLLKYVEDVANHIFLEFIFSTTFSV